MISVQQQGIIQLLPLCSTFSSVGSTEDEFDPYGQNTHKVHYQYERFSPLCCCKIHIICASKFLYLCNPTSNFQLPALISPLILRKTEAAAPRLIYSQKLFGTLDMWSPLLACYLLPFTTPLFSASSFEKPMLLYFPQFLCHYPSNAVGQ